MAEQEILQTEEEQAPKKKKGKFRPILLAIIALLCLGIAGVYLLYGNMIIEKFFNKSPEEGAPQEREQVVQKKPEKNLGPIMSLEPFLFNIAGTSGKYAKITIGVQFKDKKALEEANKITPAIRDRILTILGSKGIEVLMDVGSRDAMKKEILDAVKVLFPKEDDIAAIYITDIMIQ